MGVGGVGSTGGPRLEPELAPIEPPAAEQVGPVDEGGGPTAPLAERASAFLTEALGGIAERAETTLRSVTGGEARFSVAADLQKAGQYLSDLAGDLPERAARFLETTYAKTIDGREREAVTDRGADGVDLKYVANDEGWDTELWSFVTGEARGPQTVSQTVEQAIDDAAGEPIRRLELTGHGWPGGQRIGPGDGESVLQAPLSDEQREAFARLGEHMAEDGQIVLGGCNVADSPEGVRLLQEIAEASGRTVVAAERLQLPVEGLEGTTVTATPDGEVHRDTSLLGEVFDAGSRVQEWVMKL